MARPWRFSLANQWSAMEGAMAGSWWVLGGFTARHIESSWSGTACPWRVCGESVVRHGGCMARPWRFHDGGMEGPWRVYGWSIERYGGR